MRIQDLDDEEEGTQNVSHVQHFSTPLSTDQRIQSST